MKKLWQTLRGYFWWKYDRGSLHYDVMVTLILLFIFVSPRLIDFKDQPPPPKPHPTGIFIKPSGAGQLVFQVDAIEVESVQEKELEKAFQKVIRPIAGEVAVLNYKVITDRLGRITAYEVQAQKVSDRSTK